MTLRRTTVALPLSALAIAVVACGTPPSPDVPTQATSVPTVSTPVPSSTPAAVTATATATAGAAAPATPASPFLVITELPGETTLYPLAGKAFLSDGRHLITVDGDDLVFDPAMMAGVEARASDLYWRIDQMGGSWPDSAFLTVMLPEERTGFSQHLRWKSGTWTIDGRSRNSESAAGFASWSEGRTLAMLRSGTILGARFEVVAGRKGGPIPEPTRPHGDSASMCHSEVGGDAFAALATGEVFMAGMLCDFDNPATAVERWAPGKAQSTIDRLPLPQGTSLDLGGLVARSATEAYVIGTLVVGKDRRPYLARFRDTTWTEEPAPMTGLAAGLWLGPDGTLWTASGDTVWSRAPGASWSPMTLGKATLDGPRGPEPLSVQTVWPRGPGDVWVLAGTPGSARVALMHTRPATKPIHLPDPEQIAEEVRTRSMPAPLTRDCETPFVLLYTLGKSAPANYDFPSTRAALKGHAEFKSAELVEVKRIDKRYLGAKVPSVALAIKLADFIKQKVQGSTPQTACYNPKVTRTLDLDYATGELRR